MTSSHLNAMYDVIGVNGFSPQVNEIPPQKRGLKHPQCATEAIV